MKRIITLALAAGLVVAATAPVAQAADISVSGYMLSTGQYYNDMGLQENGADGFNINSRIQVTMKAIASENLYGQLEYRLPSTANWGSASMQAAEFGSNVTPLIRNAFIDFTLPMAPVHARIGYQYLALPLYMGSVNPVLADIVPAVVVSADLGMLQPTFAYARLGDSDGNTFGANAKDSDAVAVMVPVDMDMFTVTPWAAFMTTDGGNATYTSAYWVGATSKINLIENATFGVDFLYQGTNIKNSNKNQAGFLLDAYASYSLDMLTVGGAFWYATGADKTDSNLISAMDMGADNDGGSWGVFNGTGTLWFAEGPATWGGDRATGPYGTMGLGVAASDINVVDNLELGAHFMYLTSTADTGVKLTDDWAAMELGASAAYAIYDDLTASANLYYTIPMDIAATNEASGFTGGVTLKYAF